MKRISLLFKFFDCWSDGEIWIVKLQMFNYDAVESKRAVE